VKCGGGGANGAPPVRDFENGRGSKGGSRCGVKRRRVGVEVDVKVSRCGRGLAGRPSPMATGALWPRDGADAHGARERRVACVDLAH
jgi:hypothetical protein